MSASEGTGHTEVLRFSDSASLSEAAAQDWIQLLKPGDGERPPTVAFLGGRVARSFYQAVSRAAYQQGVSLKEVEYFWSDERCVPPQDPESNFAIADSALFRPLQVPSGRIHRIRGELPPERAAESAQSEMVRVAPITKEGQPVLDVVFLGMGEDGHVASLFPEEPSQMVVDQRIFRPVRASKPPPLRITMGYRTIAAALKVWILISGAGKMRVLQESLGGLAQTPLRRVLDLRETTRLYVDCLG